MESKDVKVTIRPYKISDVDDFMIYAGDESVTRFTRCETFISKEEAINYIKNFCIPHPFCRSICIDDRSIGLIFIMPCTGDYNKCRAVLGYAVAAEYWGQGIATMAVKMIVSQGFKEFPDVIRIEALVQVENKASQRVLQKAGFTQEALLRKYTYNKGEVRDMFMFSLLSSDHHP
ncbi:uncharacterized protein LOC110813117 [Carica papaya]|uniref:uncharacterized protein LOC110813117 n=1 Tax=Carica papaya TaxID=3649 RepID=UPI000B8CC87F|nr:uncharacterized protein LOC110813117 [Carica papaya]